MDGLDSGKLAAPLKEDPGELEGFVGLSRVVGAAQEVRYCGPVDMQ